MARKRTHARQLARHQKDRETLVNMIRLLDALRSSSETIRWHGSRESDTLRLEAIHDGMIIRLLHLLPENHEDYIDSGCCLSGKIAEEVLIEIRDITRSTGLINLVKEHFDVTSPLFEQAIGLFVLLSQKTSFSGKSDRDMLRYGQTVAIASERLFTPN